MGIIITYMCRTHKQPTEPTAPAADLAEAEAQLERENALLRAEINELTCVMRRKDEIQGAKIDEVSRF